MENLHKEWYNESSIKLLPAILAHVNNDPDLSLEAMLSTLVAWNKEAAAGDRLRSLTHCQEKEKWEDHNDCNQQID